MMIERQKLITNEINFLLENFFFKAFSVNFFRKKYFYDFVLTDYNKGQVLFREKESADHLFFIAEGEIELKIESTVPELSDTIKNLLNLTNLNRQFKDYESDFFIKNYNKLYDKINSKKVFKICLFSGKEVLGMESFYLKIPMFYSATVISDSAKCYVIESKVIFNYIFK
jgi:CRP-like cAMP-binding protein